MADATLVDVMHFFGFEKSEIGKFRREWNELSDEEKAQFKKGIGDGSLTY